MSDALTPCPYCQEPIQPLATKCRYCKELLPAGWSQRPSHDAPILGAVVSDELHPSAPIATPGASTASPPVAGYARAAGVLALIAAILAVVIPIVGVLWFSPLAVILGMIALKGGAKGFGIAVLVIVVVNMVISPTFWLNIGAGAQIPGAAANRMVTYINVFGVLGMILLLFSGRVWVAVATVVIGAIAVGLFPLLNRKWVNQPDRPAETPTAAGVATGGAATVGGETAGNTDNRSIQICQTPRTDGAIFSADQGGGQDTFFGTSYVREGAPTSPTLSFGGWGDRYYDYIQFYLPAPSTSLTQQPLRAYLCLYVVASPTRDPSLEVAAISTDWAAAQVGAAGAPRISDSVSFGPVHAGWNAVEVTSLAVPWLTGVSPNHGLAIWPNDIDHTNGSFASSKAPDKTKRPRLVVVRNGNPGPPAGFQTIPAAPPGRSDAADLNEKPDPKSADGRDGGNGATNSPQPVDKEKTYTNDQVDAAVEQSKCPSPKYPATLRTVGVQGNASLRYVVGPDGAVERNSVTVVSSTNRAFEQPAIDAIMGCTYKPAKVRGTPVRQLVEQNIQFTVGG